MIDNISVSNILNAIVLISRFNKGEASEIFDEVSAWTALMELAPSRRCSVIQ